MNLLGRPSRSWAMGVALLCALPGGASAQEPDTARVEPDTARVATDTAQVRQRCTLTWEPIAPDTRLLSVRETEDAHVSHISGRMLWTCGTATMEADSAVKYDLARRVDLIGNVDYRDTIRTLESRLLTYFELEDLIVASEEVRLERISDRSTLEGPRVEFLRAVSGVDERTTATGRPHMRFHARDGESDRPFDIDADRAVFAGEEEARAYGDVVIVREDLYAEADSAYLRRSDETGILWGNPRVEARGMRLSGDTIRFRSEDDELREVEAIGSGYAVGESFEVRSERIDIALAGEEVETVWAHGPGLAEAVSGEHHLYGDSLHFVLFAGAIDTAHAVGGAAAVRERGPLAGARLDPLDEGAGRDTTPAAAVDTTGTPDPGAPTEAAADPDTAAVAAEMEARAPVRDSAAAQADSLPVAPDSVRAPREARPAAPDSPAAARDSSAVSRDSSAAGQDSLAAPGGEQEEEILPAGPSLGVDGRDDWVRGDTVIAVFERTAADSMPARADSLAADPARAVTDPGAEEEARAPEETPEEGAPPGAGEAPPPLADSSPPRMERLIAIGNAGSFYRQVRDTAQTDVPSRNYMLGTRIEIVFEEGEPKRVHGFEAIGLYLEPIEDAGTAPAEPPDSAAVRSDTTVVPPDTESAPPDTLGGRPDRMPRERARSEPGPALRRGSGP